MAADKRQTTMKELKAYAALAVTVAVVCATCDSIGYTASFLSIGISTIVAFRYAVTGRLL